MARSITTACGPVTGRRLVRLTSAHVREEPPPNTGARSPARCVRRTARRFGYELAFRRTHRLSQSESDCVGSVSVTGRNPRPYRVAEPVSGWCNPRDPRVGR